jgi:phosphoribosylanthranilate isomerase
VDAGADAVGLVFVKASPRLVTTEQARQIVNALPAFVEPVGLFVDTPPEDVAQTAADVGLRTVQLHGHESPVDVRKLPALRVLTAVALGDTDLWRGLANLAAVMSDTPQDNGTLPGGSGRTFEWSELARLIKAGKLDGLPPFVLAGGLTPDNVGGAIALLRPYAVDVSSGVESSRGIKDVSKIRAFCEAVRRAGAAYGVDRSK